MLESAPDKSPLEAFLQQYWKDCESGEHRTLRNYLEQFPGDDAGIAREYLRCENRDGAEADAEADAHAAVAHFLEAYCADRQENRVQGAEAYQARAPRFATLIGEHYSRLQGEVAVSRSRSGAIDGLGPYRIEEEIGRGGQGIVYRAVDTRVGRVVALKVLRSLQSASDESLQRFQREAVAAARLDHPGICTVYETGVADGTPYIAMRFVEGRSVAEMISTRTEADDPSTCLVFDRAEAPTVEAPQRGSDSDTHPDKSQIAKIVTFFEKAARALHVAHEAGVIHRDVKPGNIMVTAEHEPVIMDFGLARADDVDLPTLTRTGEFFGTPAYMSPEQLLSSRVRLDGRTDVWSLGVSLYEALTLQRPFQSPTRDGLYQSILTKEPADPRQFNPWIPHDLCVVVAMALEKDRDRRYQTALDLADDLQRVHAREPIKARPVSSWTRLVRWSQRNPKLSILGAAVCLIIISTSVFAVMQAIRATRSEREARDHLLRVESWVRLADGRHLEKLVAEADDALWPVVPAKIDALSEWIARARSFATRLPQHRAELWEVRQTADTVDQRDDDTGMTEQVNRLKETVGKLKNLTEQLKELRATSNTAGVGQLRRRLNAVQADHDELAAQISKRRIWRFSSNADQLRHDKLAELVTGLEALVGDASPGRVTIAGIEKRLRFARHLQQRLEGEDKLAWDRCKENVADAAGPYGSIQIEPMPGLVPLGRDESSGLWEFWHVASGERPHWRGEALGVGKVQLRTGSEGLVLVLIPAGVFKMGARRPSDSAEKGPNLDPHAQDEEGDPHDVTLAAYLISKYEATRGQWIRLWGEMPKHPTGRGPRSRRGEASEHDLVSRVARYPVINVDWRRCQEACRRWGLELPTEAQWERACRAGHSTPYSTGATAQSLAGHANIGTGPSAVGGRRPNSFGLHDMHGNVWEWCRDGFYAYDDVAARDVDGLRGLPSASQDRVFRGGGSYGNNPARRARSAKRAKNLPSVRNDELGFRPGMTLGFP